MAITIATKPLVPAALLSTGAYAGRYPLTPRFVLTVTPKDGHLIIEVGEELYEVFPESDTRFFYLAMNAEITFVVEVEAAECRLAAHSARSHADPRRSVT